MTFKEWHPILLAALASSIFHYFWFVKIEKKNGHGIKQYTSLFIGSCFIAWGIDVLQRLLGVTQVINIYRITLGCWIMFVLGSFLKQLSGSKITKSQLILGLVGDLISYLIIGGLIFILT